MFLWLILMLIGLGVLGFAFYKVYTSKEEAIDKKLLAIAGAGALISVIGLVMTIRSLQKEPQTVFVPQAVLQQSATEGGGTQGGAEGSGPFETSAGKVDAEGMGIPKYDPSKYPEDPNGATFTAEEVNQFITRANSLVSALEDMVTKDNQIGDSEGKEARGARWIQFEMDYTMKTSALLRNFENKNGPGTGRVRQLMVAIVANLDSMQRVYHNAACFNEELDLHYISQLRAHNEKLMQELKRMFPQ